MRVGLIIVLGIFGGFMTVGACGSSSSRPSSDTSSDAATDGDGTTVIVNDSGPSGADASCPNLPSATLVDPKTATTLSIQGEPVTGLGIYDPSLVYPKGASGGVMSYSAVSINSVNTRIAVSTDLGATFQFAAEPNQVTPVTITTTDPSVCDAGTCMVNGVLWHEVSSIIADPTDPDPNGAYKVFFHSYASLDSGNDLRRDWGYIGMQTAAAPSTWQPEQKLLGWASNATISTSGVTQTLTDLPDLSDCIAFTEPGAIVTARGIDLALSCVSATSPTDVKIRVVLLRSIDHAKTFTFVATLVASEDFVCLGGAAPQILGADLFVVGGAEYVVVSPSGPVSNNPAGGYRACMTIPVSDADAGAISRSSNGAPTVVSWVAASDARFTGPCTYAEGATAIGQLVPMQFSDQSQPWFRILRTSLPEP
jgi:hypothetical protein